MKAAVLFLSLTLVSCSPGKGLDSTFFGKPRALTSKTSLENSSTDTPQNFQAKVIEWQSAVIKDCTPASVLEGGKKGAYLDTLVLKEKLKATPERAIVTLFPLVTPLETPATAWTLLTSKDQHLTALQSGARCLIRWKGELIAETTLATQIEILADFNSARAAVQFESRPRPQAPGFPLIRFHPLPEVLFLSLKPDIAAFKHISTLTGLSDEQLRPWIRWKSHLNQPEWQITLKWNSKNSESSFITSSSEALVPLSLSGFPSGASVGVVATVRIPPTSSDAPASTFQFLTTLSSSDAFSIRAIATPLAAPTKNSNDFKVAQECFFQRWDNLLHPAHGTLALKTINLQTIIKPCLGFNSRLFDTILGSDELRDRFKSLIARDLLKNPETRAAWSPSLLRYLKFQLDSGVDFVMALDPQRQDPTLIELYRSQTLLRAELSQRPSLLAISDDLESAFLKWALNRSQFEHDSVATLLLAADRVGQQLQAPFVYWLLQNPTMPDPQAPEIDFALKMKPDFRSLVARCLKIAQSLGWQEWIERDYQNLFIQRRSYSFWLNQLKFLETLQASFRTQMLQPQQQRLIAETVAHSEKSSSGQMIQLLTTLSAVFSEQATPWLERRKTTGVLESDRRVLEIAKTLTPTHAQKWNDLKEAAQVLGSSPAIQRVAQDLWNGKLLFDEVFSHWTESDRARFVAWKDFFGSQSTAVIDHTLRVQFLTQSSRWVSRPRLDQVLPELSEVSRELERWVPAASFSVVHEEIVRGLAAEPEKLWLNCDGSTAQNRIQEIISLMKEYRDTFGSSKSNFAAGQIRGLLLDCTTPQ